MLKCLECECIFNKAEQIKDDTSEILNVCPGCHSTDYEEVQKCRICDKFHFENEMHGTICIKCAEECYTDRLGLKFIERHREFYLEYWGIEKVDEAFKDGLIDVLEKDFLQDIDFDNDMNQQLKKLKEYVLDDMEVWISFLEGEV